MLCSSPCSCVDALALVLTVYEDGMFAGLPEFVRTLFDSVNREYMVNGALYMLELLGVLLVSMVTACLMFVRAHCHWQPHFLYPHHAAPPLLASTSSSRPFCRSSRSSAFRLPWSLSRRCSPRDSGQHHQDGASALYQPLCLRARHRRHFVCPDLVHAAQKTPSAMTHCVRHCSRNFASRRFRLAKFCLIDAKGAPRPPLSHVPARSAHLFCFTSFGLCLRPAPLQRKLPRS